LDPFEWVTDPLALFEAIEAHRGEFIWLPNFAFNHLVNAAEDDERRADLSSVRAFVDCSEPCKARSLANFERRFRPWGLGPDRVRTCYAMAETVFAVTQSSAGRSPSVVRLRKEDLDSGRIAFAAHSDPTGVDVAGSGSPLPGVEVAVLDEELRPVESGWLGQIAVRAPFLFDGYHLQPERTAASFHDGFFLTGDIGFSVENELFVLGRRDDVIVLAGRNVFASEIEEIVSAVTGIRPGRVFAFGHYNDTIGTDELVVLAETAGAEADPARIQKAVRTRLEGILGLVPRKFTVVEDGWIVKSTSGKINRGENSRKFARSLVGPGDPSRRDAE
jgi:acyl-CoA synthetase (AMP-forming)/AMP-acid ligase II